jgi:hypothetical protein
MSLRAGIVEFLRLHRLTRPRGRESWQCPFGVAHTYEVTIDDNCVATIKQLTADPLGNDPEVVAKAAEYAMRDGTRIVFPARPGELLSVQCSKCGRPAVVGIAWLGAR